MLVQIVHDEQIMGFQSVSFAAFQEHLQILPLKSDIQKENSISIWIDHIRLENSDGSDTKQWEWINNNNDRIWLIIKLESCSFNSARQSSLLSKEPTLQNCDRIENSSQQRRDCSHKRKFFRRNKNKPAQSRSSESIDPK